MPQLFQSCIQRQQVATCRTTRPELLVSWLEVEQAFRARRRGRAMGESDLPGELFALALAQMASMVFQSCLSKPLFMCRNHVNFKARSSALFSKDVGRRLLWLPRGA